MKANINRLVRLLEQIIEFRKVETGNLKLKLSQTEIVSFVKEICDLYFAPLSEENKISLNFKSEFDKIYGFIDCDKLDKIIFNLLSNAFKYNKIGGSVELSLELVNNNQSRNLLITVSDTGYGMSKEVQNNIFKRFYEGNFRNFKIKSTGIGLSLTYDLVRFHHGEISVESEEGIGSKFCVTLPIDKTAYDENEIYIENDSPLTSQLVSETNISKYELTHFDKREDRLRVMLVEDNKDLLNLMTENLKNEFNIINAENGKIALELLETNEIDLVVTDVLMPVMDGIELIHRMKSSVELSHIPVIVLTAKQDMEHKIEGFEAGADSYITKPFEIQVLNANIKSLIQNRRLVALSFSKDSLEPDFAKYTFNNTDQEFLERVYKIIEENVFNKDFTTNDLYYQTGMSQSTFYRKIQTLIEISPLELIRKIKIKVACKLLMEKQFTVAEIAYDLGFSEPRYFSKLFKKETGMSPTEFINKKV
jgi:DNA-binding response OmpR family regulator